MTNENENLHSDKDFDKYVYFASKAKNYTIIYKPMVEELLATGERRVAKDDDGKLMSGVRIEFHNGMKRFEKSPENEAIIEFVRAKCKGEENEPESRRMLKEITKPIKKISEDVVREMMSEKDAEIERLRAENEALVAKKEDKYNKNNVPDDEDDEDDEDEDEDDNIV